MAQTPDDTKSFLDSKIITQLEQIHELLDPQGRRGHMSTVDLLTIAIGGSNILSDERRRTFQNKPDVTMSPSSINDVGFYYQYPQAMAGYIEQAITGLPIPWEVAAIIESAVPGAMDRLPSKVEEGRADTWETLANSAIEARAQYHEHGLGDSPTRRYIGAGSNLDEQTAQDVRDLYEVFMSEDTAAIVELRDIMRDAIRSNYDLAREAERQGESLDLRWLTPGKIGQIMAVSPDYPLGMKEEHQTQLRVAIETTKEYLQNNSLAIDVAAVAEEVLEGLDEELSPYLEGAITAQLQRREIPVRKGLYTPELLTDLVENPEMATRRLTQSEATCIAESLSLDMVAHYKDDVIAEHNAWKSVDIPDDLISNIQSLLNKDGLMPAEHVLAIMRGYIEKYNDNTTGEKLDTALPKIVQQNVLIEIAALSPETDSAIIPHILQDHKHNNSPYGMEKLVEQISSLTSALMNESVLSQEDRDEVYDKILQDNRLIQSYWVDADLLQSYGMTESRYPVGEEEGAFLSDSQRARQDTLKTSISDENTRNLLFNPSQLTLEAKIQASRKSSEFESPQNIAKGIQNAHAQHMSAQGESYQLLRGYAETVTNVVKKAEFTDQDLHDLIEQYRSVILPDDGVMDIRLSQKRFMALAKKAAKADKPVTASAFTTSNMLTHALLSVLPEDVSMDQLAKLVTPDQQMQLIKQLKPLLDFAQKLSEKDRDEILDSAELNPRANISKVDVGPMDTKALRDSNYVLQHIAHNPDAIAGEKAVDSLKKLLLLCDQFQPEQEAEQTITAANYVVVTDAPPNQGLQSSPTGVHNDDVEIENEQKRGLGQ